MGEYCGYVCEVKECANTLMPKFRHWSVVVIFDKTHLSI